MTLQEFINKYKGKFIDYDGRFGNQCMDLYRQYVKEVWNLPQTPNVIGAANVFDTLPDSFEKFTSGVIKPGDVMVWTKKYGAYGHIAIIIDSNPQKFRAFTQNDPIKSPCIIKEYNYGNIKGWFRPKTSVQKTYMAITVVNNTKRTFDLTGLKSFFIGHFKDKFEPVFNEVKTNFTNIPGEILNNATCIQVDWYRKNITPLAKGQATLFICETEDYPSKTSWGFASWGDLNKPTRIEFTVNDLDMWSFNERAFHEVLHSLQFLTGQPDRTHELMFQTPIKYQELADYIDQKKLQEKLILIK